MTHATPLPFTEHPLPAWRRAVLKVGSSLLAADGEGLSPRHALNLAQFVSSSIAAGREVVIVSSGAVAAGRGLLHRKPQAGAAMADTRDMGKPITQSRHDVGRSVLNVRFFADHARMSTAETLPMDTGHHAYTRWEPVGVVAAISQRRRGNADPAGAFTGRQGWPQTGDWAIGSLDGGGRPDRTGLPQWCEALF